MFAHHVLSEGGDIYSWIVGLPGHQTAQFGVARHAEGDDAVGAVADVIGHHL